MYKVLIIYASAGDGHKKAAEAVYKAFLELKNPDIRVIPIDSLNYTSRFFKYNYKVGYMIMIKRFPLIWGLFYYLLDNKFFYILSRPFRRLTNAINAKKLENFIIKEKFDLAISTHFMGTEVISHLKARGAVSLPLITVITDFMPHRFWQCNGVDYYVVASDFTKEALAKRGVDNSKIEVLGIPLRKGFDNAKLTKPEAKKMLGLSESLFTVLVMGGGFGVGPIKETVLTLQKLDFDCQIIVVCGHNKKLFEELNQLKSGFKKEAVLFGFTRNIPEIMSASDLIFTKVGGITVSETLAKGLPVLTMNPIPGQEGRNAAFLLNNKIGFKLNSIAEAVSVINEFFHSPDKFMKLKEDIAKVAHPDAAKDLVRFAMDIIKEVAGA